MKKTAEAPAAASSRTYFDRLPPELLEVILSYLTPYGLALASGVNRSWRAVARRAFTRAIPASWNLYPLLGEDTQTDSQIAASLSERPCLLVHFMDSVNQPSPADNPLRELLSIFTEENERSLPLTTKRIAAMRDKYRYVGVGVQSVFGEVKTTPTLWRRVFGNAALLAPSLPGVEHIRFIHYLTPGNFFSLREEMWRRCPRAPVKLMMFFVAAHDWNIFGSIACA